jgi:hypothetical protein
LPPIHSPSAKDHTAHDRFHPKHRRRPPLTVRTRRRPLLRIRWHASRFPPSPLPTGATEDPRSSPKIMPPSGHWFPPPPSRSFNRVTAVLLPRWEPARERISGALYSSHSCSRHHARSPSSAGVPPRAVPPWQRWSWSPRGPARRVPLTAWAVIGHGPGHRIPTHSALGPAVCHRPLALGIWGCGPNLAHVGS